MNQESFREYCLSLPFVSERFPFDDQTLCFCVAERIFALLPLDRAVVNLKCDPERALSLREHYEGIEPGWHMNKTHWNSLYFHSDIPSDLFRSLVRHSYNCVVSRLPKKIQSQYALLPE